MSITDEVQNTDIGAESYTLTEKEDGTVEVNYRFSEIPAERYHYAEIRGNQIVSLNYHYLPLQLFRQLFMNDRSSDFFDIGPAEEEAGFSAQVGDKVVFGEGGNIIIQRPTYGAASVDEVVEGKLNELKLIRDRKEMEPIDVQGYLFDYDDKARERLAVAREVIKITGQPITWTLADNTTTELTAELSGEIFIEVAVRSNKLHVKYRALADEVHQLAERDDFISEADHILAIRAVSWVDEGEDGVNNTESEGVN